MISARTGLGEPASVRTGVGLGAAGAVVLAAVVAAAAIPLGDQFRLPPASRVLLVAMAIGTGLVAGVAPSRRDRGRLLGIGLASVGAAAVLSALTDPAAAAAAILLVAFVWAAAGGGVTLGIRVRAPVFGAVILGVGWWLVPAAGTGLAGRAAGLCLALGLAALSGVIPFLPPADPADPDAATGAGRLMWTAFFGPALVLALPPRLLPALTPDQAAVFGATLIGLGLVNLAWATIGAWRTASDADAWRYSFLADWGLVLVGLGLFRPDGLAAAYLGVLAIVAVRLPLFLWAQPVLRGAAEPAARPVVAVAGVLLAGAAPFSGFPVRLLLLQAATQAAWPLAVPLVAGMLLWVAHAVRLARTLSAPTGRSAAGLWLVLACSLVIGLLAGLLRAAGGL